MRVWHLTIYEERNNSYAHTIDRSIRPLRRRRQESLVILRISSGRRIQSSRWNCWYNILLHSFCKAHTFHCKWAIVYRAYWYIERARISYQDLGLGKEICLRKTTKKFI